MFFSLEGRTSFKLPKLGSTPCNSPNKIFGSQTKLFSLPATHGRYVAMGLCSRSSSPPGQPPRAGQPDPSPTHLSATQSHLHCCPWLTPFKGPQPQVGGSRQGPGTLSGKRSETTGHFSSLLPFLLILLPLFCLACYHTRHSPWIIPSTHMALSMTAYLTPT